jgi:hypothetical protein
MTTALISLPQREVPWSCPEHGVFVGKDILELLTSSMYVDPMSMYREYVQNSSDAIDMARSRGLLESVGKVEIRLDQNSRTVLIRDNGVGLAKDHFVQRLTALGGSEKRGTKARGFRGVGRLAGLAFCQELIFRSRQEGEKLVHELRWDSRQVRSSLRSADNSADLQEIVSQSVQVRDVPAKMWPERFFEIELRGVIRMKDDRLLNEDQIMNYLAQVAPVPFSPDFRFGGALGSCLEAHGVELGSLDLELIGRGKVFRPHGDSALVGKSGRTQFQELATIATPGRDGGVAAVSWILHHDYLGALPSNCLIEGWRFRCGDIQIGGNDLFQPVFPESRFNSWAVAETHVIDPRITPNGRRDHFEQNSYYSDLVNHLAPHAKNIARRCRRSSITRRLSRSIESNLNGCQQSIRMLKKGVVVSSAAVKLKARANQTLQRLQRLTAKPGISEEKKSLYEKQIRSLQDSILKTDVATSEHNLLHSFTPMQRGVLTEVFNAIYHVMDVEKAQNLVDKLLLRLNRRGKNKKASKD